MFIDELIQFCKEKSKNIKLKAEQALKRMGE